MLTRIALFVICVLATSLRAEDSTVFIASVKAAIVKHKDFLDAQNTLARNDKLFEGNAALLSRADAEKSPAFDFIVANEIYTMDPDASYRLHERVFKALPNVPEVNLEWAMECHRRGEIPAAISAYELFLKSYPEQSVRWALLADCYVRAAKYEQAIDAWKKARHGSNHTGIDFAIYSVYGDISALRKRADLIQRLEKGDASVVEELILKDLHFQNDWWNTFVYSEGLDRDLVRAEQNLGKDTRRFKEISAFAEIKREEQIDEKKLSEKLKAMHLLVDGGDFPVNSVTGSYYIALATKHHLVDMKDLAKRFSKEMETRAMSKAGDVEALNILCVFYTTLEDWKRVKELDKYGWERYKDVRFATSYLAELLRDKSLTIDTPEFKNALIEFPENNILWKYRLHLLGEANCKIEDIVGAIKAEYHELSPGMGAYRDSYTLKGYFALLEKLRNP